MDYQALYQQKLTTADEAVKVVKSGDWVDFSWCVSTPVALDRACTDAVLAAEPMPGSLLGEHRANPGFGCCGDNFLDVTPGTTWRECLDHAEKIGLGVQAYTLKKV